MEKIFTSYCWEDEEHKNKVVSLIDYLRRCGFNATLDRVELQKETAINFERMMFDNIKSSTKVLVVLSEGYKKKAENNIGGVGFEYTYIFDDIDTNKNKYVLISFQPINPEVIQNITPAGLSGRFIVDLKADFENDFEELLSRLMDKPIIKLSPVAEVKKPIHEKIIPKLEDLFRTISQNSDIIDLSFVNDPDIIGKWESIDYVEYIEDFKEGSKKFDGNLALKELTFLKNGLSEKPWWTWTKGFILHHGDKTTSSYKIEKTEKSIYMFFEWKSGDYIIRNMKPWYYVLKKVIINQSSGRW